MQKRMKETKWNGQGNSQHFFCLQATTAEKMSMVSARPNLVTTAPAECALSPWPMLSNGITYNYISRQIGYKFVAHKHN